MLRLSLNDNIFIGHQCEYHQQNSHVRRITHGKQVAEIEILNNGYET